MAADLIKFTRALSASYEVKDIDDLLSLYSNFICAPAAIQDHFKGLKDKILDNMRRLVTLTDDPNYKATLEAMLSCHPAKYSGLISHEPDESVADYAKRSIADMFKLIRATFPFAPVDPATVERNLKELAKFFKSIYRYGDRLYLSTSKCWGLKFDDDRILTYFKHFNCISLNGSNTLDYLQKEPIEEKKKKLQTIYCTNFILPEKDQYDTKVEKYNGDIDINEVIKMGGCTTVNESINDLSIYTIWYRLSGFWYLLAEIEELGKDLKKCAGNDVKAKCRIERFNAIKLEYDWKAIGEIAANPPPSGPESEYNVLNYMIASHMDWFYSLLATRPYSALSDAEINDLANKYII